MNTRTNKTENQITCKITNTKMSTKKALELSALIFTAIVLWPFNPASAVNGDKASARNSGNNESRKSSAANDQPRDGERSQPGCAYDNHCKGVRICHKGECLFPSQVQGRTPAGQAPSQHAPSQNGPSQQGSSQHAPSQRAPASGHGNPYINSGGYQPAQRQGASTGPNTSYAPNVAPAASVHNQGHSTSSPHKSDKTKPFATKGTLETGFNLAFSYSDEKLEYKVNNSSASNTMELAMDIGLYLGYFITDKFVLGAYASLPVNYTREKGIDPVSTVGFGFVAAPGFAFSLYKDKLYFYGEALVGFQTRRLRTEGLEGQLIAGVFGGDLGLKLKVADHALFRIGLRPTYQIGLVKIDDGYSDLIANSLEVKLSAGFSVYF